MTNKSQLKTLGVAALVVAMLIGVSASASAQQVTDLHLTPTAKQAVQCFSLARAQGLGKGTLKVYLNRLGEASGTAGAVYALGYTEGSLDAHASANPSGATNWEASRKHAAKHFYGVLGCTINEKI